eukprot:516313_1
MTMNVFRALLVVFGIGLVSASESDIRTIKLKNGNIYEGECLDRTDMMHGKGKLKMQNGEIYEGYFKNGKFDGNGKYVWKDGMIYDGHWKDGKITKGKLTRLNGNVYNGEHK